MRPLSRITLEPADAATGSERHGGVPVKPSTGMVPERCRHDSFDGSACLYIDQNSLYHTGCERHEIVKSRARSPRPSEQGALVRILELLRFATDKAHKVFQIDVAVVVLVEDRLKYAG